MVLNNTGYVKICKFSGVNQHPVRTGRADIKYKYKNPYNALVTAAL